MVARQRPSAAPTTGQNHACTSRRALCCMGAFLRPLATLQSRNRRTLRPTRSLAGPAVTSFNAFCMSLPVAPPMLVAPGQQLRTLLARRDAEVLVEAHDALSARIVAQAGLPAIWASSLTISAVWGVRDANELSWTQVADVLDHMTDATALPILADGDSGHGDFNIVRRFVRRLSQRGVAGVCFEDQCFPKANSLVGEHHVLAPAEEFCGKIRAAKDAQDSDDFMVVARVEALIAGLGMAEALRRATAYHEAGADAILIHSRRPDATEVLKFAAEWGSRAPVLIVPTTYSATPLATFAEFGIAGVIWANHTLRAAITGMQMLCATIRQHRSPHAREPEIASVGDVLVLTGYAELDEARDRYTRPVIEPPLPTAGAMGARPRLVRGL